jgi:tRNA pseudouridine38-40 synthase
LDLAYDGAPFRGFAKQPNVRTVQGDIDAALTKLFGTEVFSVGAGRTDAGVHALGQVMGVKDAPDDLDLEKVKGAINTMCGPAIAVSSAQSMHPDWHARFSARSRTYIYAIDRGESPDPFKARTCWYHPEPLDVDAMNEAAGSLAGPHDFTSFGRVPESGSAERVLYELRCWEKDDLLLIRSRANAFLQQMVRSLVGTLVYVGGHKREPDEMPAILQARDRSAAGPVAPPHGLCLVSVEYDEGWSVPAV